MNRMICPSDSVNFLQHGLEPVLKFAAEFRAGDHRPQVEGDEPLVLQLFGHVARDDALRQAFDDGGLADAGLADQHRIVFGAARKNLHHAANFFVAADHRIELRLRAPARSGRAHIFPAPRTWIPDSGCDALISAHDRSAFRIASCDAPVLLQQLSAGSRSAAAIAKNMCSVETYSSLKFSASLNARSSTSFSARLMCCCANPVTLGKRADLALQFLTQHFRTNSQPREQRRHHAVRLRDQRRNKCTGSIAWFWCCAAISCALAPLPAPSLSFFQIESCFVSFISDLSSAYKPDR